MKTPKTLRSPRSKPRNNFQHFNFVERFICGIFKYPDRVLEMLASGPRKNQALLLYQSTRLQVPKISFKKLQKINDPKNCLGVQS